MGKKMKRVLSLIMTFCMIITPLPYERVHAEGAGSQQTPAEYLISVTDIEHGALYFTTRDVHYDEQTERYEDNATIPWLDLSEYSTSGTAWTEQKLEIEKTDTTDGQDQADHYKITRTDGETVLLIKCVPAQDYHAKITRTTDNEPYAQPDEPFIYCLDVTDGLSSTDVRFRSNNRNKAPNYSGHGFADQEEFERVLRLINSDESGKFWEEYKDDWVSEAKATNVLESLSGNGSPYALINSDIENLSETEITVPADMKGLIICGGWQEDNGPEGGHDVDVQTNTLTVNGADTIVYFADGVGIFPKSKELTINFTVEENNKSKVVLKYGYAEADIKCESASGTIVLCGENIKGSIDAANNVSIEESVLVNGFTCGKQLTIAGEGASLIVKDPSGKVEFHDIGVAEEGKHYFDIVYNGYPSNAAALPTFHAVPVDIDAGIRFMQKTDPNFWDEEDWWENAKDVILEEGTKIAELKAADDALEALRDKLYYCTLNKDYSDKFNIQKNGTLKLRGDENGEEKNDCAGMAFADEAEFAKVLGLINSENSSQFWEDKQYQERWQYAGSPKELFEELNSQYVLLEQRDPDTDKRMIKTPENVKGVIINSGWYDGDKTAADPGHAFGVAADSLVVMGDSTSVYFADGVDINPKTPEFTIRFMAEGNNASKVVLRYGNVAAKLKCESATGTIELCGEDIRGSVEVSNPLNIADENRMDGIVCGSRLTIDGWATLIIKNPVGKVEFHEIVEAQKEGENLSFNIAYNGYPEDALLLPAFYAVPTDITASIRFLKKTEQAFWELEGWWDKAEDVALEPETKAAILNVESEALRSMIDRLYYCNKAYEAANKKMFIEVDGKLMPITPVNDKTGKFIVEFKLATEYREKIYDGREFEIPEAAVTNLNNYPGKVQMSWAAADGTALPGAPKDAGTYLLSLSVPEEDDKFEGTTKVEVAILKREVTVRVKATAEAIRPTTTPERYYVIVWDGLAEGDTYLTQAKTVLEGATDKVGSFTVKLEQGSADAGNNYTVSYGDPIVITVTEEAKPAINSVLFPGKKDSFTAIYTGEQICPAMIVAYQYTEGGKAKTQALKLNVDYTVSYSDNVHVQLDAKNAAVAAAEVTVRGIGEYTGEITKTFTITQKSIAGVTLSEVGDILYEDGRKPAVVVMDGTYELKEGTDYTINCDLGDGSADKQAELKVDGIGDYTGTSKKSVKFTVLKKDTAANDSLKSMADVTLTFKNPAKVYTYNGKVQKPAIVVKDGGTVVPASQYKVVYTDNINAGNNAQVYVVGKSKVGKTGRTGYFGSSKPVNFPIAQKSFQGVSVASVPVIPVSRDGRFAGSDKLTFTVKDGKRILTENVDFTVDDSKIREGKLTIGQKYPVTLKPTANGNYKTDTSKVIYVKFGQLNLANKTANVTVELEKDGESAKVKAVRYNGQVLADGTDYTATIKLNKKNNTYNVTVKAVKNGVYKGSRTVKDVKLPQELQ